MPIFGPDVSHWQGTVDWLAVAGHPAVRFAFIKASQGDSFADPQFERNWRHSKAAGLYRAPYHFFEQDIPGETQANFFWQVVEEFGGHQAGDLPYVLDFEQGSKTEASIFVRALKRLTGNKPVTLYSGGYLKSVAGGALMCDYLWLPQWQAAPTLPWGWNHWTWWQYSNGEDNYTDYPTQLPGIEHEHDMNVFYSTEDELERIAYPMTPEEQAELERANMFIEGIMAYVKGEDPPEDIQNTWTPPKRQGFRFARRALTEPVPGIVPHTHEVTGTAGEP